MVAAIEVSHVTKRFTFRHTHSMKELVVWTLRGRGNELSNSFRALDDVSFTIEQGEAVGLIGLNGSGKSTMLKLISGVMLPDDGQVRVRGRVAGLIEVGAGFHPDLTGRENIFLNGAILGMSEQEVCFRFDDIVSFSEIEKFIDTEVKFYSSGMFLRLAFSIAAYSDPDIFLIDEILAVGDEPFQKKCLRRIAELREQGQTLVIVSHDFGMVRDVVDRGLVLKSGQLNRDAPIAEAIAHIRG